MHPVIQIHPEAPPKPPLGQPCNGCGLCCLAEPCPLGMLVSRRRRGRCAALQWSWEQRRYLCGMVSAPQQVLGWDGLLAARFAPLLSRWARRWISAAKGCDAALEREDLPDDKPRASH